MHGDDHYIIPGILVYPEFNDVRIFIFNQKCHLHFGQSGIRL